MSTLTLQMPESGLQTITRIARECGESVDHFIASAAMEKAAAFAELSELKSRVGNVTRQDFDEALRAIRATDAPPLAGDEMPKL
ncbi:MAG: toxin-antitoxin system HicB family antitoxin [Prosthecobacter sp.]|jgi:hypothetical protein